MHDRAIAIRDLVLTANATERQQHLRTLQQLDDFYQESARQLHNLLQAYPTQDAQESQLLTAIIEVERSTQQLTQQLLNQPDQASAATLLLNQVASSYGLWLNKINAYIDFQEAKVSAQLQDVRTATANFQALMLITTTLCIIIGIFISYLLIQWLVSNIGGEPNAAAKIIQQLAAGDFTVSITTPYPNSVLGAASLLVQQLSTTIKTISASASSLNTSAQAMIAIANTNNQQPSIEKLPITKIQLHLSHLWARKPRCVQASR